MKEKWIRVWISYDNACENNKLYQIIPKYESYISLKFERVSI